MGHVRSTEIGRLERWRGCADKWDTDEIRRYLVHTSEVGAFNSMDKTVFLLRTHMLLRGIPRLSALHRKGYDWDRERLRSP